MNTLVYTCNDLSKNSPSLGCLELLYQSLLTKNNTTEFEFLVLTNNKNAEQISHTVVYDDEFGEVFPGYLKFTRKLPSGYDRYLYLDSDILFYEKIENVMPSDSPICVMKESECPMFDSDWHRYHQLDENTLRSHANKWCVNSGQFSFKRESNLTESVRRYLFVNRDLVYSHDHAKNEQSSFNRYLLDVWDAVDFSKFGDRVTLTPEIETTKSIFHFAGFSSGMQSKLHRMNNFSHNTIHGFQKPHNHQATG